MPASAKANGNGKLPPIQLAVCRDLGHAWEFQDWNASVRTLACGRCKTVRTDRLDKQYHIDRRRYHYERGYEIHGRGHKATSLLPLIRKLLHRNARRMGIAWAEGAREPAAS